MPLIMTLVIASILPASRWYSLFLYFMNLPFGDPFTTFANPVGCSFHLLLWNNKDEKTSSRFSLGKENKQAKQA